MRAALDAKKIVHQDVALRQAAGQAFYNHSKLTLRDLKGRASQQQGANVQCHNGAYPSILEENRSLIQAAVDMTDT